MVIIIKNEKINAINMWKMGYLYFYLIMQSFRSNFKIGFLWYLFNGRKNIWIFFGIMNDYNVLEAL